MKTNLKFLIACLMCLAFHAPAMAQENPVAIGGDECGERSAGLWEANLVDQVRPFFYGGGRAKIKTGLPDNPLSYGFCWETDSAFSKTFQQLADWEIVSPLADVRLKIKPSDIENMIRENKTISGDIDIKEVKWHFPEGHYFPSLYSDVSGDAVVVSVWRPFRFDVEVKYEANGQEDIIKINRWVTKKYLLPDIYGEEVRQYEKEKNKMFYHAAKNGVSNSEVNS